MYIDNLTGVILDVIDNTPELDDLNLSHAIHDRIYLITGILNDDIWTHEGLFEDPYNLKDTLP